MNPVVHFELPAENKDRMCKFYESAFGWKMNHLGPDMGNYIIAQTCEMDQKNMPLEKGMINGGIYDKNEDAPHPSVVLGTSDIKESLRKIKEAGGKVIHPEPMNIPGVGLFSAFVDTEGNRLSIIQPTNM